MSARHVRNFEAEGVIRKAGRNRYALPGTVAAIVEHLRAGLATKAKASDKFRELRSQIVEIDLAAKRRDLIALAEAEAVVDFLAGRFGTALDALPARVTRNPALRRGLQAEIIAMQNELAESIGKAAEALGGKQDALFGKTTD
ncbi:hypothetical protein [Methylobacterium sp. CCH7-A2]|uniref:hypothetical protein n=1 Tax=Methylobacterium sp. CCH7-A2 TaxID=1768789 RepID=UPI0012E7191A|nr:hypothetical protein [Methylobacterium sp. CCH7-A2]